MEQNELNRELIRFIEKSPNSFFAVKTAAEALDKAGFTYLFEGDRWDLTPGMSYYTTRNSSALIAFRLPEKDLLG
ncbi:MAG: M18 family aminopeptidase, partial [Clostridia bacterium]|nr:M18 family aminopeptidase [Clostridia bacterium]